MDKVLEFIQRRFPEDCHWTDGNCYYFSLILKHRFPKGDIFYDVINGHFIFNYNEKYYDWTGIVTPKKPIFWDLFESYDSAQYQRIIEYCIK